MNFSVPELSTFHDSTQGSTNSEFIARIALYHKAMYTCMHICYHTCTACKNVFHNPGHVLIRNKKNAGKHISKTSATITIHRNVVGDWFSNSYQKQFI